MAGCGGKKKVKKYDMGGMAKVRPVPEELLKDGGKRMPPELRRGLNESLRRGMKDMYDDAKRKKPPMSPLPDMARALKAGRDFAEKTKNLPKDSAAFEKMKKIQAEKAAQMKAAPTRGASGMKKGGKVKPGYHKMPDGKIMKDSDHKKKKMKAGGKVRGDGICSRGKTKGRMV